MPTLLKLIQFRGIMSCQPNVYPFEIHHAVGGGKMHSKALNNHEQSSADLIGRHVIILPKAKEGF